MLKLGKSLRKIRTKRNTNSAAEVQHKGTSIIKYENLCISIFGVLKSLLVQEIII
jgi:hypothetical protein